MYINEQIKKTPGLNNPETYLLSNNRFIDYLVLIFVSKKKAQIYTFPNRVDEYDTIRLIIEFEYKRLFRPNNHLERYYILPHKDENFLFKIADKHYLHIGKSIFTFKSNSNIVKYGFKNGYNDSKFPFAYDQTNIYYMLEQKYEPINKYKKSSFKDEYEYLYRNDKINGKNLQNYKLIHE